jgi:acid stress-induced BolA-like protein IbaG/YrbA
LLYDARMSNHETSFQGDILAAIRGAIEAQVPDAKAEVSGGGGHFNIVVTSPVFAGKSMLESQRLVYSAIAHLMKGNDAPVHAVDSMKTKVP